MARFEKLEFQTPTQLGASEELAPRLRTDSGTWMTRADECRRSGTYEAALQYYSRALEEDKALVVSWVGQVQMLIMLREYPEAEIWSRKSLELFPAEGDLHAARAQALVRLQRTKEAFAAIDAALNHPGQSSYRWTVRGELLMAGGQSTDEHCFDRAQQTGGDWLVPVEIALLCLEYKHPAKALNRARIGVQRDAAAPYAWYVQGVCLAELGFDVQARRSLETCLELKPGHRAAENRLQALDGGGSFWKRIKGLWNR